jgi:rare lipoprotein A
MKKIQRDIKLAFFSWGLCLGLLAGAFFGVIGTTRVQMNLDDLMWKQKFDFVGRQLADLNERADTILKMVPPKPLQIPQAGRASHYGLGDGFHLRPAAMPGRIFSRTEMTAAHKFLPFGTLVFMQSLEFGTAIIVEITDRGPYIEGIDFDISTAAAERLGTIEKGVADVLWKILFLPGAQDLKDVG